MIHENVDLHGIAEAVPMGAGGALRLQRVPESVREQLEEPARAKTLMPAGAELRCVIERGSARVTLSSAGDPMTARLYFGPFDARTQSWEIGADPVTIDLAVPQDLRQRFESLPAATAAQLPFHPRVARLQLFHGEAVLHGIEGHVRPPAQDELPARTMLAYGTSITHGSAATAAHLTYAAQTAWRLGCDLINLGVGGACLCEPAFGDHIAARDDWDFATLALSVNMVSRGVTPEQFRERVTYLIGTIARAHPAKPVFCISLYPYHGDWAPQLSANAVAEPETFRTILQDVTAELALDNLHFIPGPEILTDIGGLTVDMIHPADHGMIVMGENLAARIRAV